MLLTEEDSALKVAKKNKFWGLFTYKSIAYKKSVITINRY